MFDETIRAERLIRMGIQERDFYLLDEIWDSRAFNLIADERTAYLAGEGYDAFTTLDAIWHELDEAEAHLHMQHGCSPHQALLLATDETARRNLWGPTTALDRVHRILSVDLPRDVLTTILLVAPDPDETESLVDASVRQHASGQHESSIVRARLTRLAANLHRSVSECDCPASILV